MTTQTQENPMHVDLVIHVHDTDPALFDRFSQVFKPRENNGTRWIVLTTTDGVTVTLFESKPIAPAGDPVQA